MIKPYTKYKGFDNEDINAVHNACRLIGMVRIYAQLTEMQKEQLGDARRLLDAMMDRHEIKKEE